MAVAIWMVVATVPTAGVDDAGNPVTLPTGTVLNRIEWDDVTTYQPAAGTALKYDDGTGIGGVTTP
jgi:hypothetical protein